MNKEKIVLENDIVVEEKKVTFYFVNGTGYQDKNSAIYQAITHKKCSCGELMRKFRTKCHKCRMIEEIEEWKKYEKKEWLDSEIPIFSITFDKWFENFDEVDEFIDEDLEANNENICLVFGEPNRPRYFSIYEHCEDAMHEDSTRDELPEDDVERLEEEVNQLINSVIFSYTPSKIAVSNYRHS